MQSQTGSLSNNRRKTMKITLSTIILPAVLFGSTLLPLAANADNGHMKNINWRLHHQGQRINAGSKDHELNRHQQYALDRRDNRIHGIEERDREFHDGHLTKGEHKALERDLNHTSHAIHHQRKEGM
jgi:hypothetical protein